MAVTSYLVALGSNRRHPRHGRPERVIAAATLELEGVGRVRACAPVMATPPLGPGGRRYANGAVLLDSGDDPPALLARLKAIERAFGRRAGRRWGARVLDLDIILWSGGRWRTRGLIIPHPAYRARAFVLRPAAAIAAGWHDPDTGTTIRQSAHRLTRAWPKTR